MEIENKMAIKRDSMEVKRLKNKLSAYESRMRRRVKIEELLKQVKITE